MWKWLCAIALLAASANAAAQTENYKHVGSRSPAGQLDKDYYAFSYIAPSSTYGDIEWEEYRDKKEKRNTVMVIGLSGYDTYALSVLYKGKSEAGQSVLDAAKQRYPSANFAVTDLNPGCATTPVDKPFALDGRMLTFLAVCVDERSRAVYELGISWRSLILAMKSLDRVAEESEACAEQKRNDPQARCPDYLGAYSAAYRKALGSFAMKGK
ncbi:hypothetical protein ASD78_06755 [Lysobacter sp. Root667]|uniref:hypothetical protein n=1 Tax=Lysobacter sp. Root667 TaxID=1736581 RepID=UPI0006FEF791|nr:hypothetical protein [Lysobacter sp. Root667]KRA75667.1 hypothetical protein ASD78_06755 [Lysobacter sp. Root667]